MKRIAIMQARTTSTRLPGKVLLRLFGKTVAEHIITRVRAAKRIDGICVATTTNETDDAVATIAEACGASVYRGSEDDVLDRFYQAAQQERADVIIRITADDPFKDPVVIDQVIRTFEEGDFDYVSNTMHPTYPEGIDVEVFSMKALAQAWKEAFLPSEHEHVTPYIWKHPDRFHVRNVEYHEDISKMRWTLDKPEDWVFIQQVYDALYPKKPLFLMEDILHLLQERPFLAELQSATIRNEGYLKSLAEERNL